jgi:hypothetical protein
MGRGVRSVCGTRTWWVGAAVGLHGLVVPSKASAQPSLRPERELIRIEYTADARCPSLDELIAKVRAYTARWALAEDGERARHFRIELQPRDGRFVGVLAVAEPTAGQSADTSASRTITGPDCETVARGMAIAVAVAIDPSALLADRPSVPEPAPSPPPVPPAAPRPELARPPPPSPPPKTAAAWAPTFGVDARAELTSAVVTGLLPALSVALEIEPLSSERSGHSGRLPRWFRPSVAIGLRQSLSRTVERSAVTTEFLWTAAVVRLCPARFVAARERLELTPCFEGDLGALRASARGSADARSTTNRWLDAGVSARATWSIGEGWFVGGAVSLVVPVSRNRFELSTGTLISRAPPVGVTVGVGGGVRF